MLSRSGEDAHAYIFGAPSPDGLRRAFARL